MPIGEKPLMKQSWVLCSFIPSSSHVFLNAHGDGLVDLASYTTIFCHSLNDLATHGYLPMQLIGT